MLKRFGKYLLQKITEKGTGKLVRWAFWGTVLTCPGAVISTIGVSGVAITAVTVHSGIIEYVASRQIG